MTFQIVDVREADEVAIGNYSEFDFISRWPRWINRSRKVDPSREAVVHCKMGGRSARAIQALTPVGFYRNLLNLKGAHHRLVQ